MTLAQIRYNIWNLLSGGRTTHNEYYSGRQIDFQIHYYRSLLIRRQAEQQRRLRAFEQSIESFPLEFIESGNEYNVFKSQHKIPRTVRLRYDEPLTLVNDNQDQIQVVTYHRQGWDYYSKYSHIKPKAYLQNGYIYVESYKKFINDMFESDTDFSDLDEMKRISNSGRTICNITLQGIFEDPVEFEKLKAEIEEYDYSDDFEYPVGADNIQQITQSIIQSEGQVILQTPADLEHNNLPDRDIHGRQGE